MLSAFAGLQQRSSPVGRGAISKTETDPAREWRSNLGLNPVLEELQTSQQNSEIGTIIIWYSYLIKVKFMCSPLPHYF